MLLVACSPQAVSSVKEENSNDAAETSVWANILKEDKFSVLAINPGFTQTDMGGRPE